MLADSRRPRKEWVWQSREERLHSRLHALPYQTPSWSSSLPPATVYEWEADNDIACSSRGQDSNHSASRHESHFLTMGVSGCAMLPTTQKTEPGSTGSLHATKSSGLSACFSNLHVHVKVFQSSPQDWKKNTTPCYYCITILHPQLPFIFWNWGSTAHLFIVLHRESALQYLWSTWSPFSELFSALSQPFWSAGNQTCPDLWRCTAEFTVLFSVPLLLIPNAVCFFDHHWELSWHFNGTIYYIPKTLFLNNNTPLGAHHLSVKLALFSPHIFHLTFTDIDFSQPFQSLSI